METSDHGRAEFLRRVREFARDELLSRTAELDALTEPPAASGELARTFHEAGLSNWWLPEKCGGQGRGLEESVDVVSELAYGDAGAAFTLFISVIGTTMVSLYGTEELRERFLRPMAAKGGFSAVLGSEREAGSELGRTATTAVTSGNDVILDGEKFFSTNADFADVLVVVARSADRFVAVAVPRGTPGVRIVKRWDTLGLRSAGTYQVSLRNCRVPASYVLKGPGLGLLEIGLNPSRTLIAATALGIARRVRDIVLEYAATKSLGDSTLLRHPVFAQKVGHMEMCIDVMRNQCLAAAREFDAVMRGEDAPAAFLRRGALRSSLTAKLFCGQTGWSVASAGSEMLGGLGYTQEAELGKLLRDMRHAAIIEGGDDVLRDLVFRRYATPAFKRL
ncbi:acyl-CoA dehydrogenase family protein [Streptomyces sp. ODS28]|uniref:acyl-CoA dehydrogenase family protein n=1 Tax=Streptomyces sp. ODS28 TaxID=3136688 RepID=UPI0031E79AFD